MDHLLATAKKLVYWLVLPAALAIVSLITVSCFGSDDPPLTPAPPQATATQMPTPVPAQVEVETPVEAPVETPIEPTIAMVSPLPSPAPSGLMELLTYVPLTTTSLVFTDWTLLKDHLGMAQLTSQATKEEHEAFAESLRDVPVMTQYGRAYFRDHAENWGWDTLDLLWEASATPVKGFWFYVLKFRPDFDFAPVIERFREREFTETELGDLRIFGSLIDTRADWMRTTEFAILTTTIDDKNDLMILSNVSSDHTGKIMEINAARAAGQTMADWPSMVETARQLGPTLTATLEPGPYACTRFARIDMVGIMFGGGRTITETQERFETAQARNESYPATGVYEALGLGHQFDEGQGPTWSLVMHYPEATLAQADLEPRRQLASEALSQDNRPYSELFTLVNATVVEQNLILRLHAVEGNPRSMSDMLYHNDLLFAACF